MLPDLSRVCTVHSLVPLLLFICSQKPQVFKTLRLATWRAFAFWDVVAIITDGILLAAFVLRISSLASHGEKRDQFRLHSFQVLSCVAPFIW